MKVSISVSAVVLLCLTSVASMAQSFEAKLEDGRVILSIPSGYLERDMLIVRQEREQRLVRWVRDNQDVLLVKQPVKTIDGPTIDSGARIRGSNSIGFDIIDRFPITVERDGILTIDVSRLFYEAVEGVPRAAGGLPSSLRLKEAIVDDLQSHDQGIDILGIYTYSTSAMSHSERTLYDYFGTSPISISVVLSIVVLPDEPLTPRKFDPRMGFQKLRERDESTDWLDFTGDPIHRWRLEKLNPAAAISDPIEPIVFYIDPDVPIQWRPWIKEGIMSWAPAFEEAGFSNAIEVLDLPRDADPAMLWDSRFTFVRWHNWKDLRYTENRRGRGRHRGTVNIVVDPRSGELIKADILMGGPNEVMRDKYFVRLAPLDPRAQRIPFPDEVMGQAYKSLAAHEAGHAFGLRDGNFGEYAYPAESARSREWLEKMGHTPSIMSYARHNYLAQPEDGIPPELLVQRVGPADHYSIKWGYSTFGPLEEKQKLEEIVRAQEEAPWFRYHDNAGPSGPDGTNNVVDNGDPVESARLGLLNLHRIIELLPAATLHEDGGNALLEHMYGQVLDHWVNLMRHPVSMIGGVTTYQKSGAQSGPIYTPVPVQRQREALVFLNEQAFQPPLFLAEPSITRRFEASGTVRRISQIQARILAELLSPSRLAQLEQQEIDATDGEDVFTIAEMLAMIRESVWSGFITRQDRVDQFRMELQWIHVQILKARAGQVGPINDDVTASTRGLLISELEMIESYVERAVRRSKDSVTLGHLKRLLDELK